MGESIYDKLEAVGGVVKLGGMLSRLGLASETRKRVSDLLPIIIEVTVKLHRWYCHISSSREKDDLLLTSRLQ